LDSNKVNADSLNSGELRLEELGSADAEILRDILESHLTETGSPRAAALLKDFTNSVASFTKVVPRDYAAVLEVRQEAENAGIDPDGEATWKKIMEVTGG
jgi:glutamate synthase (NADPH/NADH) large chain